jgi:sialidase-1
MCLLYYVCLSLFFFNSVCIDHHMAPGSVEQDLFVSGKDGYHTYRIPSLIVTQKGSVLAFAEGRKKNSSDTGDIDLLLKRSEDGGKTWGEQMIIWDDGENVCGNPTPVVDDQTGTIWLLMTWNRGDDH